ncbi:MULTISPECIES: hypothetical protein [unclassified Roseateles]|uniref:hypothetical protein n=1 Tax=unclassified Roseateles TaxID=2626991 RepID=UPI00161DAA0A|nr:MULTISPECIES: hypothetical protein [unclassified Roseateles]MBB3291681.1 hypothetical protein [Mitsuaria sp. BK041]
MALGLLHQVGHNSNWNVESFQDDGNGDGLILSPLHQAKNTVEKLPLSTRQASLFDPQFYLPSSRKKKLLSYPFFPEQVDGGFRTATFGTHVNEVARQCIDFQLEQQFRKVVVPTRFLDQMYPDYFEMQNQFTVNAFMQHAGDQPLCLSVAVTDHMIRHPAWRRYLLNWITAFPTVDEVYLMYQHERDLKQVQDPEFLREALRFFSDVLSTGLKLTVGYTNCEGLLFSAVGDLNITMGAFENTRIFSVDKFLESEGDRRGLKARIYMPGLFNWVQFEDAKRIRDRAPGVWQRIYFPTTWADEALQRDVEPTFNQPPLYKHYFANMQMQVETLRPMSPEQRRAFLLQQVEAAQGAYRELNLHGVQLEKHGQASHLAGWHEALRTFR